MCSLVFALLVLLLNSQEALSGNPRASPHPKVLMISYDGFRHSYFGEHGPTPTFSSLINNGAYVSEMKNVFPTKTFPNHISLVTGLYPGFHGGVANSIYDRDKQEVVNMFVDGEEYVSKNSGVLPLWVVNEMAGNGRFSGVSMWPGEPFGFGPDKMHATHVLKYNSRVPWEDRADIALSWFVNDTHPANFVAFYVEEPDKSGHEQGPDSPETRQVIEKLDNLTNYIKSSLETLQLWDEVNMIITADHGMSPVVGTNILNITKYVDNTSAVTTSSSPLLFYYVLEGKEEIVEKNLTDAAEKLKFELYKAGEWPEKWNLGSMDILPDYIAIAPVGYAFQEAFWLGAWNNRSQNETYGVHGFDNDMSDMHAFMIGHGPRFRPGFRLPEPKPGTSQELMMNIDVYPMICDILGVPAPPNNGTMVRASLLLRAAPQRTDDSAEFLLPVGIIVGIIGVCAIVGFVIWKRRQGYRLESSGVRSFRKDPSARAGPGSDEEQHLLVPPRFLVATEEV